jgi:hypothetical protein
MNGVGRAYPHLGKPGGGWGQGGRPGNPGLQRGLQKQQGGAPGSDIFAQFNAWQDPNIGGQQPGPLQQGYGGFAGLGGDTMMQTKLNGFLNQYETGGERENVMNQLGYFNGGNPFDPASVRGSGINRFNRQNAQQNQQTGGYSAPGTYQHTNAEGYQPNPDGTTNMNFGGYIGNTTVGQDGSAQYSPLAPMGGRTRRTRSFGQVAY